MRHGRDTQCLATMIALLFSLINDVLVLSRWAPADPHVTRASPRSSPHTAGVLHPGTPEGWQFGRGLNIQREGIFVLLPMSRGMDVA